MPYNVIQCGAIHSIIQVEVICGGAHFNTGSNAVHTRTDCTFVFVFVNVFEFVFVYQYRQCVQFTLEQNVQTVCLYLYFNVVFAVLVAQIRTLQCTDCAGSEAERMFVFVFVFVFIFIFVFVFVFGFVFFFHLYLYSYLSVYKQAVHIVQIRTECGGPDSAGAEAERMLAPFAPHPQPSLPC